MKSDVIATIVALLVVSFLAILIVLNPFNAARAEDKPAPKQTGGDREISIGLGEPGSFDQIEGYIGLGAGVMADYEGSNDYGLAVVPLLDIRDNQFFFLKGASVNRNDGLLSGGLSLLNFGYTDNSGTKARIAMGPLLRLRNGRDQDANDALKGLGDVDGSLEIGGFMEAGLGPWSADVTVAQDVIDGHGGLLLAFGAKYTAKFGKKMSVDFGPSASWASGDYMQSYFGISNGQAQRSGYAAFDADAGFKDVGAQLRLAYVFLKNWQIEGQFGYSYLLNDAARSPLVDDQGSPHQARLLLGVAYRF